MQIKPKNNKKLYITLLFSVGMYLLLGLKMTKFTFDHISQFDCITIMTDSDRWLLLNFKMTFLSLFHLWNLEKSKNGQLLRYCLASIVTDDFWSISKWLFWAYSTYEIWKNQKMAKIEEKKAKKIYRTIFGTKIFCQNVAFYMCSISC